MKQLLLIFLLTGLFYARSSAQVSVNTDGTAPDNSSMLDVKSANKGLLIPRVALTGTQDATTVAAPATSLLIYNTATAGISPNNVTPGYYYWNNSAWVRFSINAGGSGTTNYLPKWNSSGMLGNSLLFDNGTNVGIGTTSPSAKLFISGSETTSDGRNAAITISNTATGGREWNLKTGAAGTATPSGGFSISDPIAYRLVINSSGNVGIGTTSPSTTLDVNGTITVTKANDIALQAGSGGIIKLGVDGFNFQSKIYQQTNNIVYNAIGDGLFANDGSERGGGHLFKVNLNPAGTDPNVETDAMIINRYGNVGIGTTSPSEKLTISTGINNDIKTSIIAGGEGNKSILYLGTPDLGLLTNAFKTAIIAEGVSSWSRAKLHFCLDNTTGSNDKVNDASVSDAKMTIQADGNVGIGTTSPQSRLDIKGSTLIRDDNSNGYLSLENWGESAIKSYYSLNTPSPINLFAETKIHDDNSDGYLSIENAGASFIKSFSSPGNPSAINLFGTTKIHDDNSNGYFSIENAGNTTITSNSGSGESSTIFTGWVGVGGRNPSYALDVEGSIYVTDNVRVNGYVWCPFTLAGVTEWYRLNNAFPEAWWSDSRLKQEINTIPGALETLTKLRGVTFHWNDDGLKYLTRDIEKNYQSASGKAEDNEKLWAKKRAEETKKLSKLQIGFVAQEVEKVFPDWVTTDENGYKKINMEHLNALLVNAVKEQQLQIENQQKQIEELKNQNLLLKSENESQNSSMEKMKAQIDIISGYLNIIATK